MTPELLPGLYVLATPIGNLGDLSERANTVLNAAEVVAAEDTRTSGFLVKRAGGKGRMVSLTEHNVESRTPGLLESARNSVVALVSDAGTPVIADPGARLVEAAHAAGVTVVAIPGPSALVAAISVSGFEGSDVLFIGFLPKAKAERIARLSQAAAAATVFVFFESPNRLSKTLAEMAEHLSNPEVVVCRELTKLHEEIARGRASELAPKFESTRGECTVVVRSEHISGARAEVDPTELLAAMKRAGARRSNAASEVAKLTDRKRDELYAEWDAL